MVKRDGVILEKSPSLRVREDGWVFEKEVLEEALNLSISSFRKELGVLLSIARV
jgi:hypothetical protein